MRDRDDEAGGRPRPSALVAAAAVAALVVGVALAQGLGDGGGVGATPTAPSPSASSTASSNAPPATPSTAASAPTSTSPAATTSATATAQPDPRPTGGEVLVAQARSSRLDPSPSRVVPAPSAAADDVPRAYADGCQVLPPGSTPVRCVYGNPRARTTVALVGDSKALQWLPALQEVARRQNWRIESYTKSACAFARGVTMSLDGGPYTACRTWNTRLAARLAKNPPDVVVTSNGRRSVLRTAGNPGGAEALATGLASAWGALAGSGSTVVVLRDTPSPGLDVPECVAEHRDDVRRCRFPRATGLRLSGGPAQQLAIARQPRATMIDLTPQVCPRSPCQPVAGDLLVYREGSHLTATFVRSTSRELERLLLTAMR